MTSSLKKRIQLKEHDLILPHSGAVPWNYSGKQTAFKVKKSALISKLYALVTWRSFAGQTLVRVLFVSYKRAMTRKWLKKGHGDYKWVDWPVLYRIHHGAYNIQKKNWYLISDIFEDSLSKWLTYVSTLRPDFIITMWVKCVSESYMFMFVCVHTVLFESMWTSCAIEMFLLFYHGFSYFIMFITCSSCLVRLVYVAQTLHETWN